MTDTTSIPIQERDDDTDGLVIVTWPSTARVMAAGDAALRVETERRSNHERFIFDDPAADSTPR